MVKLLLAVRSDNLGTALAEALTQYEVHRCRTGTEALSLLETLQPDVFVVEFSIPVISGLTVLQETRHQPPVILALTNTVSESMLQSAAKVGVQDVVLLPCAIRSIVAHLETLIAKDPTPEA